MKYYKAFDKDLECRGMQYEIGKEYTFDGEPIPCEQGFHFCKSVADCYNYYPMTEETRICEVKPTGDIKTDDEVKYCTNKLLIVKEVRKPREKSNASPSNSGYCNSGNRNSGDRNSGDRNSGDWNSGDRNSGDWNSGYWNSGNWNSGYWNSGNRNSGNRNSGDRNSGDRNSGDRNSGDWNSGDRNSGNWNSGYWNSGVFCTAKNPTIKMFDADSSWTMQDWIGSKAYMVMNNCPYTYSDFIYTSDMTDEEKERHPEHKTIGGYVKTFIVTAKDKQKWWDDLPQAEKDTVMALPNFDADKFRECTEIQV